MGADEAATLDALIGREEILNELIATHGGPHSGTAHLMAEAARLYVDRHRRFCRLNWRDCR